jgi:hypothetical protein
MASLNKIIEGLNIFAKYCDSDEEYICAEHDEIFAGHGLKDAIGGDDVKQLEELGWNFVERLDCWRVFV